MSSLFLLFANSIYVSTKITQGESSSKTGKLRFTGLDIAEPKLILYKDNANEWKESLLLLSRVQLILYKDNASREQRHDGKTQSYQSGHCRAEAYLIQR
jgi:hypothetical protein